MAFDSMRGSSPGLFLARHKVLVIAALVAGVAGAVFVFLFFQPQKLFLDERVDEAVTSNSDGRGRVARAPAVDQPSVESGPGEAGPAKPAAPAEVVRGTFRSLEHRTTGEALVSQLPDGSRVLRLENLETSNGPDLRVYLSAGSNDAAFGREYGKDFIELGKLKGNIGSQNYSVPPEVDLSKYRNAVIWCKRFSVGFGVATMQ